MPLDVATRIYSGLQCIPVKEPHLASGTQVALPPSSSFAHGTVMGAYASTASSVQTITPPGSGTYTITVTNPVTQAVSTTTALAYNASDATVQAALVAILGAGNVTVSSLAATFGGSFANIPVPPLTVSAGSVAQTTAGRAAGTYGAYASGNSDGTQNPAGVLMWDVTTDAFGNVVYSATAGAGQSLGLQPDISAFLWTTGVFDTSKLIGLDTNAVTKLGRLESGTVSAGIFRMI